MEQMVISDRIPAVPKYRKIIRIMFRTLPRKRKQLGIPFRGTNSRNSRSSLQNSSAEEKLTVLVNGTGGGCEWYGINQWAFNSSTFPPIKKNYLKGPGPLQNKKRLRVVKQILKERHCIKERARLIIEWRCATCTNHGYRGTLQSAILFTAAYRNAPGFGHFFNF
jgi:hypothetical protein